MNPVKNARNPLPWTGIRNVIIHDPRAGRLSDRAFRLFIISLLLTRGSGTDGNFPNEASTPEDLMWVARLDGDSSSAVNELTAAGLWLEADGSWMVVDLIDFVHVSDKAAEGRRHAYKRYHPRHVEEGTADPNCPLCQQDTPSEPDAASSSGLDGERDVPSSPPAAFSDDDRTEVFEIIGQFHAEEPDIQKADRSAREAFRSAGFDDEAIDSLFGEYAAA